MTVINRILTQATTSISDLKKNPMAVVKQAKGLPLAVLNHNRPVFYCVPPALFEAMMEQIEDQDLIALSRERAEHPEVKVKLDDL